MTNVLRHARQSAHHLRWPSSRKSFSHSAPRAADVTHLVIGGGVVGLAVARALAARPSTSTILLERHSSVGTETSSRNSEVIHAGLYYPPKSLKTRLCIRGKQQLYDLCSANGIPHRKVGKWIVAQNAEQRERLEKLHAHATKLEVPTRFLKDEEAQRREPDVRAEAGVLESPSTGIVDSHSLMGFLQEDLESRGGAVALRTRVTALRLEGGEFVVDTTTDTGDGEEESTVRAECIVNAAGLAAASVSNMLLPADRHVRGFFAKGTYFSYAASSPRPSVLVYPVPDPGAGGLGTHLTLDLSNPAAVRFGPDVEWIEDPAVADAYRPNDARLGPALDAIVQYLPGLRRDKVSVDYCGIRPKLAPQGAAGEGNGFHDFVMRMENGYPGFVNLLGIESPGLTSCLAIADDVVGLLYGGGMPEYG